ncbi:MAG: hypothetical protein AAGE96_07345 [Cyanobacteria bacterium P01_G01_bin.19]
MLIVITIPRSLVNAVATESYLTKQVSIQAQTSSSSETTTPQPKEQNYPVMLDEETLFTFSSVIEGIPAKNRADETSKTIEKVAKNFVIELDSIQILKLVEFLNRLKLLLCCNYKLLEMSIAEMKLFSAVFYQSLFCNDFTKQSKSYDEEVPQQCPLHLKLV